MSFTDSGIKYLLPLFWPIIIAYFIGKIITPVVTFMNKKLQFQKNIATAIVLALFVALITGLIFILGRNLLIQAENLMSNWSYFQDEIDCKIRGLCSGFEKSLSIQDGTIYSSICDDFNEMAKSMKSTFMSSLMTNSPAVVVVMAEIFAAMVVSVVAAFFFTRDKEKISKYFKNFLFKDEAGSIWGRLSFVFRAFIRAQLVIMVVTAVICSIGLAFLKNPYSLIIGIIVGMLDALPVIGTGIILVPWAAFYFISGKIKEGIVILIIYLVCYIAREILEPRLIGKNIGLNPLVSLICIYVGYQLFGILGVFLGPIAFVIIAELV